MQRESKLSGIATAVLLLVLAGLLLNMYRSGTEITERLDEYAVARTEYAQLREQFIRPNAPSDMGYMKTEMECIGFDALRAMNPDIVGWLTVPNTSISYPIVQGSDNAWYLRHTFLGERNASGAVFLDYRNDRAFRDPNSILHGHNMRDGSMFAPLHSWAGDTFYIDTPDGRMVFEVFNRQSVRSNDEVYQLGEADGRWQVVTLSTCINGSPNMRFIVQGRGDI